MYTNAKVYKLLNLLFLGIFQHTNHESQIFPSFCLFSQGMSFKNVFLDLVQREQYKRRNTCYKFTELILKCEK